MTTLEFRMPKVGDKVFTRFGDEGTITEIAYYDSAYRMWLSKNWAMPRFEKGPYIVQLKLSNNYVGYSFDEIRLV